MTAQTTFKKTLSRIVIGLLIFSMGVIKPQPVRAAVNMVGTGNATSCSENAFDTVFNAVESSGGGTIMFNCGSAPVYIIFSYEKPISASTVIDGGNLVTLSGGNTTTLFQIYNGQALTLDHITLTRGYGSVGGVENFGSLVVQNSQFVNNIATVSGGAIANYGDASLANVQIMGNTAAQTGGGIDLESGSITIDSSTISGNTATAGDGGGIAASVGTTLTITSSSITLNQALNPSSEGGGVRTAGTLVMSYTSMKENHSTHGGALSVTNGTANGSSIWIEGNWANFGGGIHMAGGVLNLIDAALVGNGYNTTGTQETIDGGGLGVDGGTTILTDMTISGDYAYSGGGMELVSGSTALTNVTINGNTSAYSGGIYQVGGSIALNNVTITGNEALNFAAGFANLNGTTTLNNTLLAGNINPVHGLSNCYKPITSSSFSLSDDASCGFGGNSDNANLPLGPLANHGGFSQTQLLLPGNVGIDGGTDAGCPLTDQRGVTRPQGPACDVGAVEMTATDLLIKDYLPLMVR